MSGLSGPCQWSGHPQVSLARCGGQLSFSAHLVQNLPESQRERTVICEVSRSVIFQGLLHRTLRKSWLIVVEGNSAIWTPPHPQPQSPGRVTTEGEGEGKGRTPGFCLYCIFWTRDNRESRAPIGTHLKSTKQGEAEIWEQPEKGGKEKRTGKTQWKGQ